MALYWLRLAASGDLALGFIMLRLKVADKIETERVCPRGITLRDPQTGKIMSRRPTDGYSTLPLDSTSILAHHCVTIA